MNFARVTQIAILIIAALGVGLSAAQDAASKQPQPEADHRAIEQVMQQMIQAFDGRDAAAVAACWTDDGEFVHNDGEPIRGRAGIKNGYAEFFKTFAGKPKLEIQSNSVRFPSSDMALAETTLRLRGADGAIIASGRQETVLVREAGRWKVAAVREWDHDLSEDVSLNDLEWLIGTWRASGDDGRTATLSYERDDRNAFIRGRYVIEKGGKTVETGTEIIGKDNAAGVIRSWFFESDGSFGSAVWSRDGKSWSLDLHAVRMQGSQLTAAITYLPIDAASFTWRAANQMLDGVKVADSPPIKVVKQKSAK